MTIKMSNWGTSLGSRQLGRAVKEILDNLFLETDERIVLDFDKIKLVTNSFADELFGKKIIETGFDKFKSRTTFFNVDPFVSICIKKAIVNRVNEMSLLKEA